MVIYQRDASYFPSWFHASVDVRGAATGCQGVFKFDTNDSSAELQQMIFIRSRDHKPHILD